MKKNRINRWAAALLTMALALGMTACESPQKPAAGGTEALETTRTETAAAETDAAETAAEEADTEAPAPEESAGTAEADVDLTGLSTTMLISEISNITSSPENYIGKTVKTVGQLNVLDYNGRKIFSCYVGDPAGCCGQNLEFETTGEYTYPEDYPSAGSVIFVQGTFGVYEEDGVRYCRLDNASISTSRQ